MIPENNFEEIEAYAENMSAAENDLLQALQRETYQKVLKPRMISGHLQGRLLSLLSKLISPQKILEIGTYTGYSALCLAEGLSPDGQLITIDKNEELYDLQKKYFDKSPYKHQIKQLVGNALEIIPTLDEKFDLVFMDADKANYINYYQMVFPKINSGGILITDNVLWYGKVVLPTKKGDKDTRLIKEFNELLKNDLRMESVLLPIRDGIFISRKK